MPALKSKQCTEVRFASFLSGGFIIAIVINPPERKLANRTSVQWSNLENIYTNSPLLVTRGNLE